MDVETPAGVIHITIFNPDFSLGDGLFYKEAKILNFIPLIKEYYIFERNGKFERKYIVGLIYNNQLCDEGEVPDLNFNRWHRYIRAWPEKAVPKGYEDILDAFLREQLIGVKAIESKEISGYGWFKVGDGIIFSGVTSVIYNVDAKINFTTRCKKVIRAEEYAFDAIDVNSVLKELHAMYPPHFLTLFYASLFGFMKDFFAEAGFRFVSVFNVVGYTASGKTTTVKKICNPIYTATFQTDENRRTVLNKIAENAGNTVLLDDYHPVKSDYDSKKQAVIKDTVVRKIEQDESMPNVIITSEYQDGGLSLQNREILLLYKNVPKEHLEKLDRMESILNEIRCAFLVAVVKHRDEVMKAIKYYWAKVIGDDTIRTSSGRRVERNYAYLLCVNQVFQYIINLEYGIRVSVDGYEKNLLTEEQKQQEFMEVLERQKRCRTHLLDVRDMLDASNILFGETNPRRYIADRYAKLIDGRFVCVTRSALEYGMRRYYGFLRFKVGEIVKELDEAELIEKYATGDERTQKVNGRRVYKIDWERLQDYCRDFDASGN